MIDDFMVFCARYRDVNFPTVCIKLKGQEDNSNIFVGADSVKISPIMRYDKYCFVQLQRFDTNYRKSHSAINASMIKEDEKSKDKDNNKSKNEDNNDKTNGYNCIFISEFYRRKLGLQKNKIARLEITPNNESLISFLYPIRIAFNHPEIVFRCMLRLSIIGILVSIILAMWKSNNC